MHKHGAPAEISKISLIKRNQINIDFDIDCNGGETKNYHHRIENDRAYADVRKTGH